MHKTTVYICAEGCACSCAVLVLELVPVGVLTLLAFYKTLQDSVSLGTCILDPIYQRYSWT